MLRLLPLVLTGLQRQTGLLALPAVLRLLLVPQPG